MKKITLLLLLISSCLLFCKTRKNTGSLPQSNGQKPSMQTFSTSPFVPADQSINFMEVAKGFEIKLVAAEPLVTSPVALTFDPRGRMWVVEMNSFMPDTLATGENTPSGRIVILEDQNGDGIADHRKIFLDALVLPRALCLVENGILVVEPDSLWFYEIKNDKPVSKTLVDPAYIVGGNVEHQANGLYRALDNWIYSAKSSKRYRKKGNQWLIENTHPRGQWGISQDDYGRLYANNNSQNLLADFFPPGLGAGNSNQGSVAGFGVNLINNNRVYPARPTPGVNRGYLPGILDDRQRLVNFTAACSPLLYRGGLFGEAYQFNAFVAEPAANLIKRNILTENGYITSGRQAYTDQEFLTSTDERFRPVNLYDGPDGAMYVVDMYRGILEHISFLTPYLKNEIKKRELTLPLNAGRIYKIVPQGFSQRPLKLTGNADQLVAMLGSSNGWLRDFAQKMLIDKRQTGSVPALKKILRDAANPITRLHAMWTLEGLDALAEEELLSLLQPDIAPHLRAQAFAAIPSIITSSNYKLFLKELESMIRANDAFSAPYIGFLSGLIARYDPNSSLMLEIARKFPANLYVADALISNLKNNEASFQKELMKANPDTALVIHKQLSATIKNAASVHTSRQTLEAAMRYPRGANQYATLCQTCHGKDGNGVKSLAPPLNQSEWVTGDKGRLISIVLYGLTGPVEVNKHLYKAPEIAGDMPGIGNDTRLSPEEIAQLLSYIRGAWQNRAGQVQPDEIQRVKAKHGNRKAPFTVEQLRQL